MNTRQEMGAAAIGFANTGFEEEFWCISPPFHPHEPALLAPEGSWLCWVLCFDLWLSPLALQPPQQDLCASLVRVPIAGQPPALVVKPFLTTLGMVMLMVKPFLALAMLGMLILRFFLAQICGRRRRNPREQSPRHELVPATE